MGRVVLTPALAAEFHGCQNPIEVCDAQGGLFFPLESYKQLLANIEIPYSADELERRQQEQGGSSLQEFRRAIGQP